MRSATISRRTLLAWAFAGAGCAGLAACGGDRWYPPATTPDGSLISAAITEKERLMARYRAALQESREGEDSGTAELLERLLGHHGEHRDALRQRLPASEKEPETAGPDPVAPSTTAALGVAEEAAAARRIHQVAQAEDPELAQVLADIGACEAGHAHLLSRV